MSYDKPDKGKIIKDTDKAKKLRRKARRNGEKWSRTNSTWRHKKWALKKVDYQNYQIVKNTKSKKPQIYYHCKWEDTIIKYHNKKYYQSLIKHFAGNIKRQYEISNINNEPCGWVIQWESEYVAKEDIINFY